jgi:diguanylate cyclase (GGDEF)-like protein
MNAPTGSTTGTTGRATEVDVGGAGVSRGQGAAWATQQLSEFLEVFEVLDAERLTTIALDRVAEAFDAEVVALVVDGLVERCIGFPVDRMPAEALASLSGQHRGDADFGRLGTMHSLSTELGAAGERMLVLRTGDPFDQGDEVLLRGMGRALSLARRAVSSLASEREARAVSELGEVENLRLVALLRDRHLVGTRLQGIQREITRRVDLSRVLDAIVLGTAELLGVEAVTLRVQTFEDPDELLVATVGAEGDAGPLASVALDRGSTGRAFVEDRLVISEDHEPLGAEDLPGGLHAAIAAPVHRDGAPVGVLSAGTASRARRFSATDCETLEALAEHASLAVDDDSILRRLHVALEGATHDAHHDALTGLSNRRSVMRVIEERLSRLDELGTTFCVFVDVDHFKRINDMYGHTFGDHVLVAVGERLKAAVRAEDVVARLAGDEFVVIASQLGEEDVAGWSDRLLARLADPMVIDGRETRITASIGIASGRRGGTGEELIVAADVAMYRAKQEGRSRVLTYDHRMRAEMLARREVEDDLASAVARSELVVHYQPLVDLPTMAVVGFESLVRWQHPRKGLLHPVEFLDVAEECGAIFDIDEFVLRATCAQLARWLPQNPELTASVNLSAGQLVRPDLVRLVEDALVTHGVPGDRILLELIESVLMDDRDAATANLSELSRLGVRVGIDDFGTGYSSLQYLRQYPVDVLKVDRSFVSGLGRSRDDETIVRVILRLADALGHAVVVEGVETVEQLDVIRSMGFTTAQGFLFSKPLPADEFGRLLDRGLQPLRPTS